MRKVQHTNSGGITAIGCVHGRFQPFHRGHLDLVWAAYELSEFLYVGLTNSEPSHVHFDAAAPHRHAEKNNPFPYFARMEMVLGSVLELGADLRRVRVTPFPINRPELLELFIPPSTVHWLTVYDDWGYKKKRTLENAGYEVRIIEQAKVTKGTRVRDLLRRGENLEDFVPPFVARYLAENPDTWT